MKAKPKSPKTAKPTPKKKKITPKKQKKNVEAKKKRRLSVGASKPASSSSAPQDVAAQVVSVKPSSSSLAAASTEPGRPTANSHLAKNKKKAWRRVDVNDVEGFLDEQRVDERIGAAQLKDAPDNDLFVIDEKGALNADPSPELKKLNQRVRASLAKPEPLDPSVVFRNIRNDSKVGPATDGVNRVRTVEERRRDAAWRPKVERKLDEKAVTGAMDREKARRREEQRARLLKGKALGKNAVFYDLWSAADGAVEGQELDGQELVKHTFIDTLKTMTPKCPEKFHHNPTVLPKVELPHPGMSYNPCVDDHRSLVETVVKVELKKDREAAKWRRQTVDMFPTIGRAPTEESKILELAEGLFEEETGEGKREDGGGAATKVRQVAQEAVKEEEEPTEKVEKVDVPEGDEEKETVYKAPIRSEDRKTRQKRRREHESKMKAIDTAKAKKLKQKESAVFRIKQIRKELDEREKDIAFRKEIRKRKMDNYQKYGTKKLSKNKYEEPDAPVKFVEEITGSLRGLKPEGHLVVDRFKSLQKRNVIETRVREKNTKAKLKRFITRDKRKFIAEKGINDQGFFKKIAWHR